MNPELNREYPDPGEAKLIEEMVKVPEPGHGTVPENTGIDLRIPGSAPD